MESFPEGIAFQFPWRDYQARVLKDLDSHLSDERLHVVAAPGSGKTVLGLEVMLRLNKPTLILAPTLAIRNQWVSRFTELFLQTDMPPEWISSDPRRPEFVTVCTYQGLHALTLDADDLSTAFSHFDDLNLGTIIIDEAHHLRNAWWRSLEALIKHLDEPTLVSLTATPPYDVSPEEWARYQSIAGNIDAEISVPELVLNGDLCPHQDYVYLNTLSEIESLTVFEHRKAVRSFLDQLRGDDAFKNCLRNHPYITQSSDPEDLGFDNPAYVLSMLVFLKSVEMPPTLEQLSEVGIRLQDLPALDLEWAETLLQSFLFQDTYIQQNHMELVKRLEKQLRQIGALERRKVQLRSTRELEKLLSQSTEKLSSIRKIASAEVAALGSELRMVILTDFIRKSFLPQGERLPPINTIGVVPVFETLRRERINPEALGLLCGSLILIPKSAAVPLKKICKARCMPEGAFTIAEMPHIPAFCKVTFASSFAGFAVEIITELFTLGHIQILVGTKSLLGEGWDAPSLNCLILASFVGSFMLSNQMRGRAIRLDPTNPNKVANIWHLASVEEDQLAYNHDMQTLHRRFQSFVGISHVSNYIESGLERLQLLKKPYSRGRVDRANTKTLERSSNRNAIRRRWHDLLKMGEIKQIIPELPVEKTSLPRPYVFIGFWSLVSVLASFFFLVLMFSLGVAGEMLGSIDSGWATTAIIVLVLGFGYACYAILPKVIRALILYIKNGPLDGNLRQVGEALVHALFQSGQIETPARKLQVIVDKGIAGQLYCGIRGGTAYDKQVFLDALSEVLGPIDNPRYLLVRRGKWRGQDRLDFHAIPSVLGTKKENALLFSQAWDKYVSDNKIVYTRSALGRRALLKARKSALANEIRRLSRETERHQEIFTATLTRIFRWK